MSELAKRHETVAANARRAEVATPDVMQTVALLGETVEDLKARLPFLRELDGMDLLGRLKRVEDNTVRCLNALNYLCRCVEESRRESGKSEGVGGTIMVNEKGEIVATPEYQKYLDEQGLMLKPRDK